MNALAIWATRPPLIRDTDAPDAALSLPMTAPNNVDRTTGAVRDVEHFVRVTPEQAGWISRAQAHNPAGAIAVAVLHNGISRKALALGPFATAAQAWQWWSAPGNVIAKDQNMICTVLTPAPVQSGAELDAEDLGDSTPVGHSCECGAGPFAKAFGLRIHQRTCARQRPVPLYATRAAEGHGA